MSLNGRYWTLTELAGAHVEERHSASKNPTLLMMSAKQSPLEATRILAQAPLPTLFSVILIDNTDVSNEAPHGGNSLEAYIMILAQIF